MSKECYRVYRQIPASELQTGFVGVGNLTRLGGTARQRKLREDDQAWFNELVAWVKGNGFENDIVLIPEMSGDQPIFGKGRVYAECTEYGYEVLNKHPDVDKLRPEDDDDPRARPDTSTVGKIDWQSGRLKP